MSTPSVWTETATVRPHEVTPHGIISVPALCIHLQEAAGRHADALGVSGRRLRANDRAWVLAHLSMEIERLPDWGDDVVVMDRAAGANHSSQGNRINYLSVWVNLNCLCSGRLALQHHVRSSLQT